MKLLLYSSMVDLPWWGYAVAVLLLIYVIVDIGSVFLRRHLFDAALGWLRLTAIGSRESGAQHDSVSGGRGR